MKPFIERLKDGVIVCDGAMGTMLYTKGIYINRCFEGLNLQAPNLVQEVHKGYIEAGAEIIETNTYGANRLKLLPHGLENDTVTINKKGVMLAKEIAGDKAYVAGSVGPLGKGLEPYGKISPGEAKEVFKEQIKAIAEAGVDLIILETISNLNEMKIALSAAKEVSDIPVVTQMTITEEGTTVYGVTPETIVRELYEAGATVVGINCTVGPKETMDALVRMRKVSDIYLSAQPNAGQPQLIDNRSIYLSTPEYIAEYARRMIKKAGVNIIGGCCGTTPSHIKAIKASVKMLQPGIQKTETTIIVEETLPKVEVEPVPQEQKSPLASKLASGKFVVSIEIDPPQGTNLEKTMNAAKICADNDIDCVNIADGPRASARMSPLPLAEIFHKELGIDPIIHYCCRDRNLLGMQADLLGANALGLTNILIITGDPPKLGDYPDATAVFDVDSIGLVRIANRLNHGTDLAGKPIGDPTKLFIGVGANPGAIDFDEEMRRFELKVKGGAEYVLTQPVYDLDLFEKFHKAASPFGIPILIGILPLFSYRNAEFLHNEVPGMNIPTQIRDRMEKVGSGPKAQEEGIAIAREALQACRDLAQGVYIMPPFNKVSLALEVLK